MSATAESEPVYDHETIKLDIRSLDSVEFEWKFKMPEYQAIDLYFVFDLSYSMRDDLNKLSRYCGLLFEKFAALYPTPEDQKLFHVGLGTFIDKRLLPAAAEWGNDALRDNPCLTDEQFKGKVHPQ